MSSPRPDITLTRSAKAPTDGFYLPDGTHVNPHIQMTKTAKSPYSGVKAVTMNGKPYWLRITSVQEGKQKYHSLTSDHWEKLIPSIQNVFTASMEAARGPGNGTDLSDGNFSEVNIPLADRAVPITYKVRGEKDTQALRDHEMHPLRGGPSIPIYSKDGKPPKYVQHDFMKDVRIAFRHPHENAHTFIDTIPDEARLKRERILESQKGLHPVALEMARELEAPVHADVATKSRYPENFELSANTFMRLAHESRPEGTSILPVLNATTNFSKEGAITMPDATMSATVEQQLSAPDVEARFKLHDPTTDYVYLPVIAKRRHKGAFSQKEQAFGLYVDKKSREIYVYNPSGHPIAKYPHLVEFIKGYKAAQFEHPNGAPAAADGTGEVEPVKVISSTRRMHQEYKPMIGSRKKSSIHPDRPYQSMRSEHYNGLRYQLRFFEEMAGATARAAAATDEDTREAKRAAFTKFTEAELNREMIEAYAESYAERIRVTHNAHFDRAHALGI
ncbi:MAG: hypothetical protein S4CHLAM37_03180 [Chlamydiia bacterium]|nr:hypothetical protein [Chlamydiia bacterium]